MSEIPPGMGKTIIALLLALYYSEKFPDQPILILTTTPFLCAQLVSTIGPLIRNNHNIKIDWKRRPSEKVAYGAVIVDEADDFVE